LGCSAVDSLGILATIQLVATVAFVLFQVGKPVSMSILTRLLGKRWVDEDEQTQ
jgi:hypothetical protein